MPISQDTIIRVSFPDGSARRRLPRKQMTKLRWINQRFGGYQDVTLTVAARADELITIQPGDRVDIYRVKAGEPRSGAAFRKVPAIRLPTAARFINGKMRGAFNRTRVE